MTTKCALTWARRRWEDLLFPILNMKAISPFFLCEIVAFLDGRVKVTICIDMFSSYSENSTVCRPFYRKVFEEVWNLQSTDGVAITGHKSKSFIEWLKLGQFEQVIPESCSSEREVFKTTRLFKKRTIFSQVIDT